MLSPHCRQPPVTLPPRLLARSHVWVGPQLCLRPTDSSFIRVSDLLSQGLCTLGIPGRWLLATLGRWGQEGDPGHSLLPPCFAQRLGSGSILCGPCVHPWCLAIEHLLPGGLDLLAWVTHLPRVPRALRVVSLPDNDGWVASLSSNGFSGLSAPFMKAPVLHSFPRWLAWSPCCWLNLMS